MRLSLSALALAVGTALAVVPAVLARASGGGLLLAVLGATVALLAVLMRVDEVVAPTVLLLAGEWAALAVAGLLPREAVPFAVGGLYLYAELITLHATVPRDAVVERRRLRRLLTRAGPVAGASVVLSAAALAVGSAAPEGLGARLIALVAAVVALGVPVMLLRRGGLRR